MIIFYSKVWLIEYINIRTKLDENYRYIFTRSSFNAIDVSFRIFKNFTFTGLFNFLYEKNIIINFRVLSGLASTSSFGTLLSQYNINSRDFCTQFNNQTKNLVSNVWLRVQLIYNIAENSFIFKFNKPSISYLLTKFTINNEILNIKWWYNFIKFRDVIKIIQFKYNFLKWFSNLKSTLGTLNSKKFLVKI